MKSTREFYCISGLIHGLLALLVTCAFSLAAHLTLGTRPETYHTPGLAEALFGEVRGILGDRFYRQADLYFHRGLDHINPENRVHSSWFAQIQEELEPHEHLHAESKPEIREIIPWLELTMRVDPENLESVLVAAYWLGRHLDRPDLAEQLLLRAQRRTPFAYAVQLEKAKLFLHDDRREPALAALNAALAFWPHTGNPDDEEDRLAKAEALMLRGLLLEIAGQRPQAAHDYRDLLTLFPERPGPRERLQAIEQGIPPAPPADELLAVMTEHAAHVHCEHD